MSVGCIRFCQDARTPPRRDGFYLTGILATYRQVLQFAQVYHQTGRSFSPKVIVHYFTSLLLLSSFRRYGKLLPKRLTSLTPSPN